MAGLILLEYERDRFRTDVVYQELFDESLHPVVLDPRFDEDPTHETVFQFLKSIFEILRVRFLRPRFRRLTSAAVAGRMCPDRGRLYDSYS